MKKIGIVIGSTSGLTEEEANNIGYGFLPITIICDEKAYAEGIDIDHNWALEKFKEGKALTTSQPSPGEIMELEKEWNMQFDKYIVVCLSKGISGTYDALKLHFKDNDDVYIVDTNSTAIGEQYVANKISEKIKEQKMSFHEICEYSNSLKRCFEILLIPNNLTQLKNGGRISPAAAAIGNLLNIKPILRVNNTIDRAGKSKGHKKTYKKTIEMILERGIPSQSYICHYDGGENLEKAKKIYEKYLNKKVEVSNLSSVIGSHTGTGAIAFAAFWEK